MGDRNGGRFQQSEDFAEQLGKLYEESLELQQQLNWISEKIERLENISQMIPKHHNETNTPAVGLLTIFEGLENRLLGIVQQMTKDNAHLLQQITKGQAHERQKSASERTSAHRLWIGLTKYIVSVTLAAVITYIFTKGVS
ncbi:hypothetical protein [Paenibacillus sp. HJGM_3]|uniref:hypothetical protein n=1 Tax=Paenibacillus sp. HJGM_3 TaxID=3379816 RepID=UPI00385916B2